MEDVLVYFFNFCVDPVSWWPNVRLWYMHLGKTTW